MKIKNSTGDRIFNIVNYTLLGLLLLVVIYPLWFVLIASFSDPSAVNIGKVWLLPVRPSLAGYIRIFENEKIWTGYMNTIMYTVLGVMFNLFLTMTIAYVMTIKNLSIRKPLLVFVMIPMYFSGGLIPTYITVSNLNLDNTRLAMIILGGLSIYNVIIARSFIKGGVPDELFESASLDGCSHLRFFISFVLPLSKAGIAVLVLYYGVSHWNEYMNSLIYLRDSKLYSLQIILRNILLQEQTLDMTDDILSIVEKAKTASLIKYGVVIVSSVPVLIMYPFAQKYFVQGTMIGSLKG